MKRAAMLSGIALLLGACKTSQPIDYTLLHAHQEPVAMASHISERVGACWFGGDRPAFAEYSYAPELNSFSDRPRVLIVDKSNPTGLPQLVIEVVKAKRGSDVKLFGPLMSSGEASAIYRDVGRWAGGARDC
jgi:hypothetical protein